MVSIEEIRSFQDAACLKDPWNRIVEAEGLDISLSFDFTMSLWEAHLDKRDIALLIVKDGNTIAGIFPLIFAEATTIGIFKVRKASLISNLFSLHNGIICRKSFLASFDQIADYLKTRGMQWDVFDFSNTYESSGIYGWLANSRYGKRTIKQYPEEAPYITLPDTWEAYAGSRTGNFRQNLKRKRKKMSEAGLVEETATEGTQDPDFLLKKIFEIEAESWKEEKSISIVMNEKQKKLYELLFDKMNKSFFVTFLRLNGEYIAFMLNIISGKTCFQLKLGYKSKYKELSPGFLLTEYTVKRLIDMRFEKFDLLAGSPRWKTEWATGSTRIHDLQVYNSNPYASFICNIKRLGAAK